MSTQQYISRTIKEIPTNTENHILRIRLVHSKSSHSMVLSANIVETRIPGIESQMPMQAYGVVLLSGIKRFNQKFFDEYTPDPAEVQKAIDGVLKNYPDIQLQEGGRVL